jgi:hypothetical protein
MPKSKKPAPKDPYRVRACRLCKAKFKPTTHVISCADTQEFCTPNHRKEYWKYGGLPFDKLMARLEKRAREIAREEVEAMVEKIAARMPYPNAMRSDTPRIVGSEALGIPKEIEGDILNRFAPSFCRR